MKSEREREAKEFRATGEEEAQKILCCGRKNSYGDYFGSQAFGAGIARFWWTLKPSEFMRTALDRMQFFAFYRSMEAYRNSMGKDGTSMVLSPDSSFFRFFKDKEGAE